MSNKLLSSFRTQPLWLILAVYTTLALAYNFAQPPFEPSDDQYQFGYIRYLIEQQQLPVAQRGELTGFHHPPLYFMLAALVAAPFPTAGKTLTRTVYWEPLSRTDLPYSVLVHLIDAQTETLIAQRDTYPGLGRYPTTA